ncbi:MAG: Wzz/FepE/Etk N-terminal domain-containing protein [Flavobacteriales bacterium]
MQKKENLSALLFLKNVINNFKSISIITILFFVASIAITLFIPKKYKAVGVVYPTSSNSIKEVSKSVFFGYEFQADRLIQLFESQQMKDKIIEQYNLLDYYEIDKNDKDWLYHLNKQYDEDIQFSRTKFISVSIEATFEDPVLASDIVNTMMTYIDTIRRDILFQNIYTLKDEVENSTRQQENKVDSLLKIISTIESNENLTNLAANTINAIEDRVGKGQNVYGDKMVLDAVKQNFDLNKVKLVNTYYQELNILNVLNKELNTLKENLSLPFPKVYKVIKPKPDYKKVSPSLLINGILGILTGLAVSVGYYSSKKWVKETIHTLNKIE